MFGTLLSICFTFKIWKGYISLPVFWNLSNNWTVRALPFPWPHPSAPPPPSQWHTHPHTSGGERACWCGIAPFLLPPHSPLSCSAIGPDSLPHFSLLWWENQATPKFNCHVQVLSLKKTFHTQSDTGQHCFPLVCVVKCVRVWSQRSVV